MPASSSFTLRSVRNFAYTHDSLPAFHAAYLLLTFLAAAMFNFGFFALLIVCHMALDTFKYRKANGLSWSRTLEGVVRESLTDITLFLMGFVVAVYLHPSLTGLTGIKGMMLAEITIVRGVGVMTPKLKILYDFIKIIADMDRYLSRLHPKLGKSFTMLESICVFSMCVTLGMLIIAPMLLLLSSAQYAAILVDELMPWVL